MNGNRKCHHVLLTACMNEYVGGLLVWPYREFCLAGPDDVNLPSMHHYDLVCDDALMGVWLHQLSFLQVALFIKPLSRETAPVREKFRWDLWVSVECFIQVHSLWNFCLTLKFWWKCCVFLLICFHLCVKYRKSSLRWVTGFNALRSSLNFVTETFHETKNSSYIWCYQHEIFCPSKKVLSIWCIYMKHSIQ